MPVANGPMHNRARPERKGRDYTGVGYAVQDGVQAAMK